jgi:hypothetical protein
MARDELTKALWQLPYSERMAALSCSVVEEHPGATAAVRGLLELAAIMAARLLFEQRVELAERLRDLADHIERRREHVPIE